jgi:predicted permease
MGMWIGELTGAVRRLARARAFTAVAVLTMGVGIGAFTAIFGLVESVLLEPMPYDDPDELRWAWRDYVEASFPRGWLAGPDIVALREHPDVFTGVVALRTVERNLSGADGVDPAQVTVSLSSHDLFEVLGVSPVLGRAFRPEEDVPGGPSVAVLSHELWRVRFGADPTAIGRTIMLDDAPTEIVGVTPEHFRFVKHGSLSDPVEADLYLPMRVDLSQASPSAGSYAGLVRVDPQAAPDRVDAALAAATELTNIDFRERGGSPIRLWTVGLEEDLVAGIRPALTALVASAAFLLLMLAANLATLLLGRAALREHELGIRIALGAGRTRVLAGVVAEVTILAVAGGTLGVLLAALGTDVVVALAPADLPRLGAVGIDASVLLVALAVTAAMTLVACLTPSLYTLRARAAEATKGGTRSSTGERGARARDALVAAQVALSLMLLVGAGLTVQAFAALLRQDPGFDPGPTLTFEVPLPDDLYPGPEAGAFHDELRRRIAALPGVSAVGASNALPLTQLTNQSGISFPGAPGNSGDVQGDNPLIDWFRVTPGYFVAAGYRLLAGRGLEEADADSTAFSLVIDDVLARRFFPDGSAVGSRAAFVGDTATIVGVVDQARLYRIDADDRGQAFISAQRFPTSALAYAVRTELDPAGLTPGIRSVVRELDASVPVSAVRTLDRIVQESVGQQRLSLRLIVSFALGALLLATLGIYGVVSNAVVRRTQEIGVRMALGANADRVARMVLSQGLRLSTAGAVLGLVGALAASRVIEGIMVGVEPRDPLVYAGVAVGLLAVAALASYLPARRATRIDPIEALRPE